MANNEKTSEKVAISASQLMLHLNVALNDIERIKDSLRYIESALKMSKSVAASALTQAPDKKSKVKLKKVIK